MRKASKILCLIGGIFGIALAIMWLVLSIVFFVFGGFASAYAAGAEIPQAIKDWLYNYMDSRGTYYTMAALATVLITFGVEFIVFFVFCIPSAVISFILNKKERTGLPLPIVLVFVSWAGNLPAFAGGILAILNWIFVERREPKE